MGVEVIVRCDAPGCNATAPAPDGGWASGPGDFAAHSAWGTPAQGWIDGEWNAPDGWVAAEDMSLRCPEHSA